MPEEKYRVGDRILDTQDRAGRVTRVNEDGSLEIDLYSQYWDSNDRVVTRLQPNSVRHLKD